MSDGKKLWTEKIYYNFFYFLKVNTKQKCSTVRINLQNICGGFLWERKQGGGERKRGRIEMEKKIDIS